MKLFPNYAGSKDERSAIKVLLIILFASLLSTLIIVYLVSLLLTGK